MEGNELSPSGDSQSYNLKGYDKISLFISVFLYFGSALNIIPFQTAVLSFLFVIILYLVFDG